MSVRIIPARSGKGFEYDIRITWPDGDRMRERGKSPATGMTSSRRWVEAREREILVKGKAEYRPLSAGSAASILASKVPTLGTFWPRVVSAYYEANRRKASTVNGAESIFKNHLKPALGTKHLHLITTADVQDLKGRLADKGPKTVNNVLSVLSRALRCAVDWDVIKAMPCKLGLLKVSRPEMRWYEIADFQRLVEGAEKIGTGHAVLVLLAGSAGLRRGEIRALKWTDVDLERKLLHVQRAFWRQVEGLPKGNRPRVVPMTQELAAALKRHKHLGDRVLLSYKGKPMSNRCIRNWMRSSQVRAGLPLIGEAKREQDRGGAIHMLRHSFCSHLAIAGVPAKAIQELAGHADLATTQKYMHLSPRGKAQGIDALSAFYEEKRAAG